MDGRGGCCITRYSGGVYDMSKVDRIMLRYRPIAPKPATGGSVSGGCTPENNEVYRTGRGKRKYVRDNKRSNNRKRKASPDKSDPQTKTSSGSASGGETVVTLPLLPEIPDRKDLSARVNNSPIWLSFEGHVANPDPTVVMMPQAVSLTGSCVTVECVTDTWVDWNGLGCTDEERMMNLERDTCPGMISDGLNRVMWTNKAYREMVGQVDGEMMVWLVTKECVSLPVREAAFTCRVRVTCGKERNSLTTLPCDVWRMDGGGFAWRLDVKAALCLGR